MANPIKLDAVAQLREIKYWWLLTVFVATMTICSAIGSKLVTIFGLTFSASAFSYAVTFPCTDAIAEVWGKPRARITVWCGFLGFALSSVFVLIATLAPGADFWLEKEAAFNTTLGLVPRYVAAGSVAYLISQMFDVWAFHRLKELTQERHLWLRNNASTMASQFIDSAIFIIGAFAGEVPAPELLPLVFGQWLAKAILAGFDTPFVYWIVHWIRAEDKITSPSELM